MNKVLDFIFPTLGIVLLLSVIGGYFYFTSLPASGTAINVQILDDKKYLSDNQQMYADCYYTTKSNADFNVATITNRLFNAGTSKEKLESLEASFKDKYVKQCEPVLTGYESRYDEYKEHKIDLAESRLTKLDKLLGKQSEVTKEPSDIFSLYEMHDPKTLQYPTYREAKLLYSSDEYEQYVEQNIWWTKSHQKYSVNILSYLSQ